MKSQQSLDRKFLFWLLLGVKQGRDKISEIIVLQFAYETSKNNNKEQNFVVY